MNKNYEKTYIIIIYSLFFLSFIFLGTDKEGIDSALSIFYWVPIAFNIIFGINYGYISDPISKFLGNDFELIKGVKRKQGIMVSKGNPLGIKTIEDLARKEVAFVNRQKGSGTRILTDYLLKKAGIEPSEIAGYEREMTTHMAVAAAVESGTADAGVGVYSAAKAMDLDFIYIGDEDYDFAVKKDFMESETMQSFVKALRSKEIAEILEELGGYEI